MTIELSMTFQKHRYVFSAIEIDFIKTYQMFPNWKDMKTLVVMQIHILSDFKIQIQMN